MGRRVSKAAKTGTPMVSKRRWRDKTAKERAAQAERARVARAEQGKKLLAKGRTETEVRDGKEFVVVKLPTVPRKTAKMKMKGVSEGSVTRFGEVAVREPE